MNSFQNWSIRHKLVGVIMICCAVSVIGGGAALIGFELWRFKPRVSEDLIAQADLLGANSAAALAFNDQEVAQQTLQALRTRPAIVYACLYGPDGSLFAQYVNAPQKSWAAPALPATLPAIVFEGTTLHLFRPIRLGDDLVGTIHLRADLRPARLRLLGYTAIVCLVIGATLIIALMLAHRLERLISLPIRQLAEVAQEVGKQRDYSRRVPGGGRDEIGVLTTEFNRMLAEIALHENQLVEQKQLLESILESMGDGVVVGDAEGRLILFSTAAREMVGMGIVSDPPGAWSARYGLYLPDMKTPFPTDELPMVRAIRGEPTDRVEMYIDNPEAGKRAWLSITGRPLRDHKGKSHGGVLVMRDITESKQTQAELHKISERLHGIFHSSRDGIVFGSLSGYYLDVNEAFTRMVGYTREELLNGMSYQDLTEDKYQTLDMENAIKVAQGQAVAFEKEYVRKDGTRLPVELTVFPVKGEDGAVIGMAGFVRDISERKAAESALREREIRWQSLVNNSHDFVMILDGDDRVTFINRLALGYRMTDVIDKSVYEFLPTEARDRSRAILRRVRETGEPAEDEVMAPDLKGRMHWFDTRIVPIRRDGVITDLLLICTDVTERKRLEREVLEVADREQGRIGRDLHDGLCQLLVSTAFAANMLRERLDRAHAHDAKLAGEISDMINDGITQARTVARVLNPVSLDVEGLESALRELAKGISRLAGIPCRLVSETPVLFEDNAAATHLFRIAQEAVNNAVRHAGAQSITISLAQQDGLLSLDICDDGLGMPDLPTSPQGMGLRSMSYRAHVLGALLEVKPNQPRGTRVRCLYRLRQQAGEVPHG